MPSVQEQLQAARDDSERRHPVSLPLPGYKDDALVIRYRAPDWDAARGFIKAQVNGAPTSVELEAVADGLLAACTGTEAHLNGEVTDLPHKLGADLAEYLGLDVTVDGQRVTDRQAVFLLVPDDIDLVEHWSELVARSRGAGRQVEEEVLGESQAS